MDSSEEKVLKMVSTPLAEWVKENATPPLGAENIDPVFRKYGYTFDGIGCGWRWFTNKKIIFDGEETEISGNLHYFTDRYGLFGHAPIEEATNEELWKIAALCEAYWGLKYETWYERDEEKLRGYRSSWI